MELLNRKYIFFDGGMGTMLIKRGLRDFQRSDILNLQYPEIVTGIHKEYVDAGSDIVNANTFASAGKGIEKFGYTTEQTVTAAIANAKKAAGEKALVALDIGPTGEIPEPYGDLEEDEAIDRYRTLALLGEKAGADLAAVETMGSLDELSWAVSAISDNTKLPIFATMTFLASGKTFYGCSVEDFAEYVNSSPIIAAGINCSATPAEMLPACEKLAGLLHVPMIVKLNSGIPDTNGNYSLSAEAYAEQMEAYKPFAKIVGGCCGTTPEHIRRIKESFR